MLTIKGVFCDTDNTIKTASGEDSQVWLEYKYDEALGAGIQGRLNQVIYPLLNIWGNWVDKNLNWTSGGTREDGQDGQHWISLLSITDEKIYQIGFNYVELLL